MSITAKRPGSLRSRAASVAKATGCRTANTLPAPRVARTSPARSVVRPTTPAAVQANAILAQAAFSARWDLCPVSAQDLFDLYRERR
jgi:hypothetical protein